MDKRLNDAAKAGDIDTLYTLLSQDPLLFENIDKVPFSHTPLHIAALAGQTSFVMELSNLKPSFIRKLNTDGYSPIHLASIVGKVKMVREQLEFDHGLGLLKGREWRTPLHCSVINGRVEVIHELLSTCSSDWLKALTVRKETVLHLALKYGQMEVFDMLFESVKAKNAEEIVNWKDREGNTILHLAAYRKQLQIIELLLRTDVFREVVDLYKTNTSGLTAWDVLRQQTINEYNVEIGNILRCVEQETVVSLAAPISPHRSASNTSMEPLIILEELLKGLPMEKWSKEIESSPSETRSTLMVVAVLIATVTFQVALSPPGGFDRKNFVLYYWEDRLMGWVCIINNIGSLFFLFFSIINSIGFAASIAMIAVLTRRFPLKAPLRMAVLSLAATYLCAITYVNDTNHKIITVASLLMLTMLLLQWIHLKIRSVKKLFYVL